MAIYTGAKCLICSEKFNDDDDIVVCPECGTPYHRACYKEKQCINKALHESGGSWMLDNIEEAKKVPDMKICPNCQSLNKGDAEECSVCGKSMKVRTLPVNPESSNSEVTNPEKEETDFEKEVRDINEINSELFYKIGQDPDEIMDEESGVTSREIADYVRTLWFKYLFKFKKLKNSVIEITTNLNAFLFPEYFFAARKMYPHAVVVMILNFLISIPALITSDVMSIRWFPFYPLFPWFPTPFSFGANVDASIVQIGFALSICLRIVCCLKADSLYFNSIVKKLKKFKTQYSDETVYKEKVKEAGGVSLSAVFILFLCAILLYFIFCLILTIIKYC